MRPYYYTHPPFPVNKENTLAYLAQQQRAIDNLVFQLNVPDNTKSNTYFPHFTSYGFTAGTGFVLLGRPNNGKFRLYVADYAADSETIGVEPVVATVTGDKTFISNAYGPVLTGQTNSRAFRFYVNDSDAAAPMIGIEGFTYNSNIDNRYDYWFAYNDIGFTTIGTVNAGTYLWYINDLQLDGIIGITKQ